MIVTGIFRVCKVIKNFFKNPICAIETTETCFTPLRILIIIDIFFAETADICSSCWFSGRRVINNYRNNFEIIFR
jgi:hypothetical protein